MEPAQLIFDHFPEITNRQREQFNRLFELYHHWNQQINVISRKDYDNFYERHVLHSLGIAKVQRFEPGTRIMDIGCGGGFPGIPLAILHPESEFTLVDSIGKKIKVVNAIAEELGLSNVIGIHERAEKIPSSFDFIVSRAVTRMEGFLKWTKHKFKKQHKHDLKNGILYLKGGDLKEEMSEIDRNYTLYDLPNYFEGAFFETKKVVYVEGK